MKKIALVVSPMAGANAVRGVGFYTSHLLNTIRPMAADFDMEITDTIDTGFSNLSKYDLVHYPFFNPFKLSLPLIPPAKTVVTIHDIIPLEFPLRYPAGIQGRLNVILAKLALTAVSRVITDSYASVKSLVRYLKIPHEKINMIHLASSSIYKPISDKKILSKIRSKYDLPQKFLLYVGDINYNKNLPSLVSASLKTKTNLVMVGKAAKKIEQMDLNHPELIHLKDVVSVLASPLIYRVGFVPDEDLCAIYNLAFAYCQPSFAEGFGLPVLEAMACGTPVICSNTHSLPEIAGSNVLYFDPNNLSELIMCIKKIFGDSKLARLMSKSGLQQAARFSWQKAALQTLQVYRSVLN